MRSTEELTELFRAQGRKVTPQRQRIFGVLQGDVTHPSAEAVYERVRPEMPTISLKTVYQTLNDLAELGEVAALDLGTGSVRFDPNVEIAHQHLVCLSCGKVRDVTVEVKGLSVPPGEVQGYEVHSAEVVFRGLCGQCRSSTPEGTTLRRDHVDDHVDESEDDLDGDSINVNNSNNSNNNSNTREEAWPS